MSDLSQNGFPLHMFTLHKWDSRKLLDFFNIKNINGEFISCTITSPPYFDMKFYDADQIGYKKDYQDFLKELSFVFKDIYAMTNKNGSLWIIVDDFTRGKELIPFPFDLSARLTQQGWILKEIFIWKKDKTLPFYKKGSLRNIKEYIFFFLKSESFTFNVDNIREINPANFKQWWIKYPERYHPKGILPTNVWEFPIPTQGSWGGNSIRHYNPLPHKLIERILLLSTKEYDVVLDPFAGTGTVLAVSNYMNRYSLGFEINDDYINMFKNNRINEIFDEMFKDNNSKILTLQKNISERIIRLRILKYCKTLLRELSYNWSIPIIDSLIVLSDYDIENYYNDHSSKLVNHIKSNITLITSKKYNDNIIKKIYKIISKPPFTKYEIKPTIKILHNRNDEKKITKHMRKKIMWLYLNGNTYQNIKQISFEEWKLNSEISNLSIKLNKNIPPILSNIKVYEEIPKTWKPKEVKIQDEIKVLEKFEKNIIPI